MLGGRFAAKRMLADCLTCRWKRFYLPCERFKCRTLTRRATESIAVPHLGRSNVLGVRVNVMYAIVEHSFSHRWVRTFDTVFVYSNYYIFVFCIIYIRKICS